MRPLRRSESAILSKRLMIVAFGTCGEFLEHEGSDLQIRILLLQVRKDAEYHELFYFSGVRNDNTLEQCPSSNSLLNNRPDCVVTWVLGSPLYRVVAKDFIDGSRIENDISLQYFISSILFQILSMFGNILLSKVISRLPRFPSKSALTICAFQLVQAICSPGVLAKRDLLQCASIGQILKVVCAVPLHLGHGSQ